MVDQDKLSKANDTLKGQSQQDEHRKPSDLRVAGSRDQGPSTPGSAAGEDDAVRPSSPG